MHTHNLTRRWGELFATMEMCLDVGNMTRYHTCATEQVSIEALLRWEM